MATNGTPLDDYIPEEEWAKARGVTVRTLKRDRQLRRGPMPILLGRKIYYRKSDIAEHLNRLADERNGKPAGRQRNPARVA